MTTLIIYAHPETEGHCPEILKNVEAWHKEHQIEYTLLDLYKMEFDPVLKADELYTAGNQNITEENKKIQEKLKETEKIVIIHPVWWGSYPAILKGFFDRILTSGFAFNLKPLGFMGLAKPIAHLTGKKAAVIQTTGSPKIIAATILGNRFRKTMKNETLGFCGISSKFFLVDKATQLNEAKKEEIERIATKAMKWLY